MNKIPTLFLRDPDRPQLVTREPHPDALWVLAGEGVPTIKRDGTNVQVAVTGGALSALWKRRNPTREEKARGQEPGYIDCPRDDPANKHIWAAVDATSFTDWPDGLWPCEALGPKIQGGVETHTPLLYPFSWRPQRIEHADPRDFEALQEFLSLPFPGAAFIEGIVWHHPDGRMAKLKRKDLGLPWPVKR